MIPRQWKVIQHVREKITCRDCEKISEPPAPFHVIAARLGGPSLLAMMLFEKFGQHQPLNRQAERYAREGVPLSLSTLADQVGAGCAVLEPLLRRVEAHVLAAERLHGDDTTVPVLAKGKTDTGRCWVYVRDDRPFGGRAPPAAMFYYSRDRGGEHPRGASRPLVRASCRPTPMAATTSSTQPDRKPGPILEAACWAHARRPFFALADIEASARRKAEGKTPAPISPMALEVVRRIDRAVRDRARHQRQERRRAPRRPPGAEPRRWSTIWKLWMRAERPKLSRGNDLAKAMDYMLKRWPAFTRFLDDGRVCLSNNAAERGLRGIALGRKSWLFAGSDRGGERAAAMYSLIVTAKMNDIDPQAWLADVLARIAEHPGSAARRAAAVELAACRAPRSAGQPDDGRHPLRLHHRPCRRDARRGRGMAAGGRRRHGPRGWLSSGSVGVGEDGVLAFTEYGIECLKQTHRGRASPPSRAPPPRTTPDRVRSGGIHRMLTNYLHRPLRSGCADACGRSHFQTLRGQVDFGSV